MILNVYNTRDERAGEYGTPIFTIFNNEQMLDNYKKTVDDSLVKITRMMEIDPSRASEFIMQASQLRDCVIYKVGTFDSKTGNISFLDDQELVCRIGDFFPRDFFVRSESNEHQQAN